jgi:tetratricopeptide (TPR) repeat protein
MIEYDKIVTVMVAVVSLLLGVYNTYTIQNPPDSSDLVTQGNQYFAQGDYKSAINCYEKALKFHSSFGNALKYKGFALFNLGMEPNSPHIKISSPAPQDSPVVYALTLIEHVNSTSFALDDTERSYLEASYQYLQDAARANPSDLESLLYGGIVSLYLLPSPGYDPVRDFERALRTVDDLSYAKSMHVRAIKRAAWTGKGVAYLKMGDLENAESSFRSAQAFSVAQ